MCRQNCSQTRLEKEVQEPLLPPLVVNTTSATFRAGLAAQLLFRNGLRSQASPSIIIAVLPHHPPVHRNGPIQRLLRGLRQACPAEPQPPQRRVALDHRAERRHERARLRSHLGARRALRLAGRVPADALLSALIQFAASKSV